MEIKSMLYEMAHQHGGDIYEMPEALDFSVNINPYGVPERVREAVRQAASRIEQYPDPFCRKLIQTIAEKEQVPESWIFCGNGAAEIIYSYCEAVKPRAAAETAPAFSEYSLACKRIGSVMERYPLNKEKDFQLEDGILSFLRGNRPDVLFLCNPNNPDGRNIPLPLLKNILQECRRYSISLFLDECFLELSDHDVSMKSFLKEYPELFILKAFTKNYGIAGVRLGYGLSANPDLLKAMAGTVQPWNVSVIAQEAGIAALQESNFIPKARDVIRKERPWLKEHLEHLGFFVCRSEANYLLFQGPAGLDLALLAKGIRIRNCSNYHGLDRSTFPDIDKTRENNLDPGAAKLLKKTDCWYRISVRLHEENEKLIRAMQEIIDS